MTGRNIPVKLVCVAGARPNFMKLAPLFRLLRTHPQFIAKLVHTGQHYDEQMSGAFFRDLDLPEPDYYLGVGSGTHGQQTAEIIRRLEPILMEEAPEGVLVVGDVNSTLAAALTAAKLNIPVVHIEAGLRSFDRSMPEEINRVVTDAVSSLLLASEPSGVENLRREGVPAERIRLIGNLMIDSLLAHLPAARALNMPARFGFSPGQYGVLTLHRPANVDQPARLKEIFEALGEVAKRCPLIFPVHPRTRVRLAELGICFPDGLICTEPLRYPEFVGLMAEAAVVFTDSGGVQEETTVLGIPCLTLRNNTERPITIEQGTNRLAGTSKDSILTVWQLHLDNPKRGRVPELWDGKAADRAMAALEEFFFHNEVQRVCSHQ